MIFHISGARCQDDFHWPHGRGGGRGLAPVARVAVRLGGWRPQDDDMGHQIALPQQTITHGKISLFLEFL